MKKLVYLSNLLTLCLILCSTSGRAQAPVIATDPANATACVGTTTMFTTSVVADTIPAHYLWETSADLGATWDTVTDGGLYSGATNDTLTVSAATSINGNLFRAIAINDSGVSSPSENATLTVTPLATAGTLSGPDAVCNTGTITLVPSVPGGTWVSYFPANATVFGGVVTGISWGTTTIYYIVTNACSTDTAYKILTVDSTTVAASIIGSASVCSGSSIHFTNTNLGGVWSLTNANATITTAGIATGAVAGMDTVNYTVTNACNSVSSTATFTIETPIEAGTITGPSIVCNGSLIPLANTTPGGFWISSDAAVATVDASGNVTGRGVGTATISYLFSNACGASVSTATVTVDNPASMIVGIDSVGVGHYTTLSDTAIGGTWVSADTTIATVNATTGVVHGIDFGIVNITYSVTNSCGTSWAVIAMNVGYAPSAGTITGADSVCKNDSVAFMSTIAGGTWSVTNANASVAADGMVTGIVGGSYDTVRYTVNNAFGSSTTSYTVYINQPPVITDSLPAGINVGTLYGLYAIPAGGVWTTSDPSRVHLIGTNHFVITLGGDFDFIYTVSNVCGPTSDTLHLSLPHSAGVSNVTTAANGFDVFPNPNNGSFTLNLTAALNEQVQVNVINSVGQTVNEISVATNKANTVSLDLASGVYFLNAATATGNYSTKITIAK